MPLQGFVQELHRKGGLSQTDIARRSGLSQGAIYKILAGIGKPQLATYQKLSAAFPEAWRDYIRRHPSFRKELNDAFGWVLPEREAASLALPDPVRELAVTLQPRDVEQRVSELQQRLRDRYRDRVKEITERVKRELDEHLKLLEAEDKADRVRRKRT